MDISTNRFGVIEIDDDLILEFPAGLLGFTDAKRFALIHPSDDSSLLWLQCIDDANLAFVVADPCDFVSDYAVPTRPEMASELGLEPDALDHDWQALVICNRSEGWLTGNLLGPLMIHVESRRGVQMVLTDQKWGTRHPLLDLAPQPLRKSA
ncbi:MAG: flagellar assembly protein FliW [Planctomycetota bacterium]